jgi:YHS domain-containing protein
MGGAAKDAVFIVHHGKKVHFCCPGCDSKFKAEPDRYLRAMRADPEMARRIDTAEAAWAAPAAK